MAARRASGTRVSRRKTMAEIVQRYREEATIGRGKEWCLNRLEGKKLGIGKELVVTLSIEWIVWYITVDRKVKGATAGIDLT